MNDNQPSYDETVDWFYDNQPFMDVCEQNMLELYDLFGYPETWEDVAWFLRIGDN